MQKTFPQCGSRPGNVIEAVLVGQRGKHTLSQRSVSLLYVTRPIHKSHLPCTILRLFPNFDITFTTQWRTNSPYLDLGVHKINFNLKLDIKERNVGYLGGRWSWAVKGTSRATSSWGKHGNYFKGRWMVPRVGLDRCGNLAPTGIRSSNCPFCSHAS